MLRFPPGMRDRIKRAADTKGRSMNAEIVATLAEHYPEPAEAFETAVDALMDLLVHPSGGDGMDSKSEGEGAPHSDDLEEILARLRQEVERRRR